nr:PLP-dependent aminotransferase family protein [Vibrio sonorensis]
MEIATSLKQTPSSYIREILSAATSPDVISLAGGLPDAASFPMDLIKASLKNIADTPSLFQYGETRGYPPLLSLIKRQYLLDESIEVLATTGSQQALDLIARAYINSSDTIVMEAPSYLGALQVFNMVQADIQTVAQTEDGPDLTQLEQIFATKSPKLFYAVPDFHNPTGLCWSENTRRKVAQLCLHYKVTLVEDAPYRQLRFNGNELPMVSEFCQDSAIVLRSFSKVASPGIRVGVVHGPKAFVQPLIQVKQSADLHSSVPMQAMLSDLLSAPEFPHHLEKVKSIYRERHNILLNALRQFLPDSFDVQSVDGGMFLWLDIPKCDEFALCKRLLERGVAVVPSSVFYPERNQQKSG